MARPALHGATRPNPGRGRGPEPLIFCVFIDLAARWLRRPQLDLSTDVTTSAARFEHGDICTEECAEERVEESSEKKGGMPGRTLRRLLGRTLWTMLANKIARGDVRKSVRDEHFGDARSKTDLPEKWPRECSGNAWENAREKDTRKNALKV